MSRMEMRSREAPMEWEREQDRNLPNIFSSPQPPAETTTAGPSNGQQQRPFGSGGVQRGSSFTSNQGSFTSDGWGATTPKPFRQDSQLSAGVATTSRENSFTFGSGGGSFSRSNSPSNATPQGFANTGTAALHRDGSGTTSAVADATEVMEVDKHPFTHHSAKTSGTEPFDMGSLRNGVVTEKGLSPRRGMPGKTRSSSSSVMLGSRTSSMQYRGSGASQGTSKFWSDEDDSPNEDMSWPEDDDQEEDAYGHRGPGRNANRHKQIRNMDGRRRRGWDQNSSERRRSDNVRPSAPQGRVWSENVDLPYILSGYVQVAMNSAFVGVVIYIIYNFITTIQSDVTIRAEDAVQREKQIIAKCDSDYYDEKCHMPHGRYLELLCQELMACKNKPHPRIERSAVAAQTFALIFNSFVHTISYKTMGFLVVIVFGGMYFSNHAISSYRHNHLIHHQDPIAHPGYAPPPSITAAAANKNSMIPAGLTRHDSNSSSREISLGRHGSLSWTRGGSVIGTEGSRSQSLTLQHRGSRHALPNSDDE
ncbi:hypothetical protein BGZ96_010618 [Linnemannia gamsii]|uniref:Brl1/Brr6 domain-containing protein n=1 Tax=Linnemannia gamsii TaxID=64522 RepID=A0ABQ7KDQ4_9FUNG|nr:hypothetical protein BGZ96_010618 [Linnemannia gamsii]